MAKGEVVYLAIGLAILLGLWRAGVVKLSGWSGRGVSLIIVLWPLLVPFLVWHGISVLRWAITRRRAGLPAPLRRPSSPADPPHALVFPALGSRKWWPGDRS